jgi:hypothetical protein
MACGNKAQVSSQISTLSSADLCSDQFTDSVLRLCNTVDFGYQDGDKSGVTQAVQSFQSSWPDVTCFLDVNGAPQKVDSNAIAQTIITQDQAWVPGASVPPCPKTE